MKTSRKEDVAYVCVINLEKTNIQDLTHVTKGWENLGFNLNISYKIRGEEFWKKIFGQDYAQSECRIEFCTGKKCAVLWLEINDPKQKINLPFLRKIFWQMSYSVFLPESGVYGPYYKDEFDHMLNFMVDSTEFPEVIN